MRSSGLARASTLVLAATLCAPARAPAQEVRDPAMCRSFCDADAKQCRADAKDLGEAEASPFDPNDFNVHAHPQAPHDDFSADKQRAVEHAADKDRFTASQKCTATRMACVQRCAASAAMPGASAATR